jgi:hypothetical protein
VATYLKKQQSAAKKSSNANLNAQPASNDPDALGKLKSLTETFRSALVPWRDGNGTTRSVTVKGEQKLLLRANASHVQEYAREYTEIWNAQSDMMKTEMVNHWYIDCRWLYIEEAFSYKRREWAPVRFDHAVIDCYQHFSGHTFLDNVNFHHVEFMNHAMFQAATFEKIVNFDGAIFLNGADFSNARFKGQASCQRITTSGGILNFSNARFERAPVFHETKLPQGSAFDRTTFPIKYRRLSQAEAEQETRAFRTLKQAAASYRGQQDEAEFFALEQNARRIAFLAPHLVWKESSWREHKSGLGELFGRYAWSDFRKWRFSFSPLEWFISLLYNCISGYGRSPSRAIFCFALANVVAFAVFLFAFDFGSCSSKRIDYCSVSAIMPVSSSIASPWPWQKEMSPPAHLVIQNLLNPSGLVSEKALISVHDPVMLVISIAQFAASYLILFLVALAVRTRFQKGSGGGDK